MEFSMTGYTLETLTTFLSNTVPKLRDEPGANKSAIMPRQHEGIPDKPAMGNNIFALIAISIALPLFPIFLLVVVLARHCLKTILNLRNLIWKEQREYLATWL